MSKPKNRIAEYFNNTISMEGPNKFSLVEFEKFDPTIIQNIIQESDDEDPDEEFGESFSEDKTSRRLIVSQDSQMLQTIKLWVGNTKINISPSLPDKIVKIEGVESYDTISRYRFRVGIGKMFNENQVKAKIAEVLANHEKTRLAIKLSNDCFKKDPE